MRLLEYFHGYPPQTNLNPFRTKSNWTPPLRRDPALDTFLDAVGHDLFKLKPALVRKNLTTRERHASKMLSRRTDIVIKSADKGSGTVVMDRDWYINECLRELSDTKFYLTIRLQARVFYEQIVNEAQPSWLSLVENEGE